MSEPSNYVLKVEFLENNQLIDEEEEFRSFCMNIVVPNTKDRQAALSASAETNVEPVDTAAVHSSSSVSSSGSRGDSSKPTKSAPPVSIKRVKPAYVQTLRPESAQVLDDDVRLTYARTFFNAFNGFEMEDIGCKLAKYCVDDCVMTVKWIGEKGNPCGPNNREVRGILSVTTFLEAILVTAIPDCVMQLQDSKLRVKPDRSSYLLCKYTFSGTQVTKIEPISAPVKFSLGAQFGSSDNLASAGSIANSAQVSASSEEAEQVAKKMRMEDGSGSNSSGGVSALMSQALALSGANAKGRGKRTTTEAAESAAALPNASGEVELVVNQPMAATMMLPAAIKMNIVGTLIIHINANNKIHRFEYIQKVIKLS